jgi:hypothetical protein
MERNTRDEVCQSAEKCLWTTISSQPEEIEFWRNILFSIWVDDEAQQ